MGDVVAARPRRHDRAPDYVTMIVTRRAWRMAHSVPDEMAAPCAGRSERQGSPARMSTAVPGCTAVYVTEGIAGRRTCAGVSARAFPVSCGGPDPPACAHGPESSTVTVCPGRRQ